MTDIRIVNLVKEFKDLVAVRDLTITFPSGEVTCLLGPSGCGKTTLMRMIAGLEEPTRGDVYFDDERVTNLSPSQRDIGMVFQYPVVYRGLNVYRNIELPLIENKLPENVRKQRVEEVAEIMGIEDDLLKDITQLDNSTRQKVAVARAVARQPKIILFDEPITNVDVNSKDQLKEALKRLTRQLKNTIVYVTHDQTEAMTLADQIALMRDGAILQRDTPRELYNHPNDVFGGWFLGNPGMSFVNMEVENGCLDGGIFSRPVLIKGDLPSRQVQIGIRPEHIRVGSQPFGNAVLAQVLRKSLVVGGQVLLTLKVGERTFKAKVRPVEGRYLAQEAWVELPLDRITVFGPEGKRLEVSMALAS